MLTFATVNWRNYQGRGVEYVNILHDMVRRNLSEGTEGRFVVFTDNPLEAGYDPAIEVRELPAKDVWGWYNKLQLFRPDAFTNGDRIVYFDLDTLITGPLDDIVRYRGDFAILRDAYRPDGLQSSVMLWEAGKHDYIWEGFAAFLYPELPHGDQEWIERSVISPEILQEQFPGSFYSYKKDCTLGIPPGARIVFFHGLPRPHECDNWVSQVWKLGASASAQLELVGNTTSDVIERNIRLAEARENATWLTACATHDKVAAICAGGPSLKENMLSIAALAQSGAQIFACNGAAEALRFAGVYPDFHVVLDARADNLAFSNGIGLETICLYASQCDPKLHEAAGDNLVLWHPAFDGVLDVVGRGKERVYIGGGTTCGMKAITLAWALGYRKIHLYGFDSCYRDGAHHAYPQPLNDAEQVLDVEFNGASYKCAPWMIQQAEDFERFGPQLMDHGVEFHVHGDGLIPAIAEELAKGRFPLEAADFRAEAILSRLNGIEKPQVAEVGVFAGDLSRRLLARRDDLHLLMIDSWAEAPKDQYTASGDFHASLSAEEQKGYFALASNVTEFAKGRRNILCMDSKDAARAISDAALDLAFLDADHSYEGCKSDIAAYYPKVRPGGVIGGHDYANDEFPFGQMVKRAVDEFVDAQGLALELGPNYTWFAVKPGEIAA